MPRVYRRRRTVAVSESTRREMRDQLGWDGPIGILANGARPLPTTTVWPRRRIPTGWWSSAGWCRTSGSTWSSSAVTRCARSDPTLRLDVVRQGPGAGPGSRSWPTGSASPTGSPSTATSARTAKARSAAPGRPARLRLRRRGLGSGGDRGGRVRRADRRPRRPRAPRLGPRRPAGWLVPDATDLDVVGRADHRPGPGRTGASWRSRVNLALTVKACLAWATDRCRAGRHMHVAGTSASVEEELGRVRAATHPAKLASVKSPSCVESSARSSSDWARS